MPDLKPLPDTALGLYRHYKGGEYEVIGVARHSETHEPLVVYCRSTTTPAGGSGRTRCSSKTWWPMG
jgi:Protein of unknown function (DUF1653)